MTEPDISQRIEGTRNVTIGTAGGSVTVTYEAGPTRHLPLDSAEPLGGGKLTLLPSLMVHPLYTPVPLVGREAVLAELHAWAEQGSELAVNLKVLSGPGGSGKTRQGLELCRSLTRSGWAAGFLQQNYDIEQLETLLDIETPRLVVVDYAETRAPQLEEFVRRSLDAVNPAPPTRPT